MHQSFCCCTGTMIAMHGQEVSNYGVEDCMGGTCLSLKTVAALCVNATVINDILQCSVCVSTTASMVTIWY